MSYNYGDLYGPAYDFGYGFAQAISSFMIVYMVFALAAIALVIVAQWKLFKKAGEPGWAAIIPFYNSYVMYKIAWGKPWFFLFQTLPSVIVSTVSLSSTWRMIETILQYSYYNMDEYEIFTTIMNASSTVMLTSLLSIVSYVFFIICMVKLAKAFGKGGGGFACGLIFLNTIFICILGFSKNIQYVGPDGVGPNGAGPRPGIPPVGGYGGGYQNPYQGGYQNPYQGGHQPPYQGGFQNPNQSGYQGPYQGGYQNPNQGYQNPYQGGFQNPNSSPYQSQNENRPPEPEYRQYTQAPNQNEGNGGGSGEPQQPPAAELCPACGAKLNPNARYCTVCGAKQ